MAPRYAVSDSDDDSNSSQLAAPSKPSDGALEKALRDAVAKIYQSGKMEELTVKRVRMAAERALGSEEGFFKGDSAWKAKSDQIIKDEVEVQDRLAQEPAQEEEEAEEDITLSPQKTSKPTKRAKPTSAPTSRKRRKTETPEPKVSDDEETGALSDSEDDVKNITGRQSKTESERADSADAAEEAADIDKVDSESEMSVVLDEEPKPSRKRGKSSESTSAKGKKKAPAKSKDANLDPNEAEIKRLQGWLVKCGIRKVWSRELAPYDTPKAKIKHLKDMLKDAGMDGRYSLEKAKQIKEKREFEADLAMIKEGEKHWGRGSVEEESDSSRPRRRLNRGRQTLAFLESDGEETD
ncbi:putative transcriptional regulator [Aspergillus fischeri NRRL 181]|uniref:Transcriptional regulator, putative n=1 Tax=Neosartorya fischeri (strain ATCC 1020 / DSM 3700 / CBS 544.65 / FGSC A1164 / JCM 1740 / NRRL 181 / WB 181) TaxID=331117 RepID=A1D7G3_NEOFI|nr:transcriptional regulator, putative [Aspergillus fischeri NRRL 181]EAW21657.1 transcriptional regulator, putative [Aspergillus fischeri NRRL 181]KAG2024804.1 hypothetical protein GB937_003504 [Aspergillus fischeri]